MNRKIAFFRFYEELNDFLPRNKRKISFEQHFEGNPGIKDVIEALGVPHAEVDMILVNGQSVDFEYQLQDGDRVAVYPVFEALDISAVSKVRQAPLREPKFILDVHLGKLAKRLRLLGFDTLYRNDLEDNEVVEISLKEKRIILTRDIGLLKNKKVTHGYWLRSQQPKRQLREIVSRFDLKNLIRPFTRCLECNGSPGGKRSGAPAASSQHPQVLPKFLPVCGMRENLLGRLPLSKNGFISEGTWGY